MKNLSEVIPGGKVRLRGRGSGFNERDTGQESTDPLQINVSVPSREGFLVAKHILTMMLEGIYHDYYLYMGHQKQLRQLDHPRNMLIDKAWSDDFMQRSMVFQYHNLHEAGVSDDDRLCGPPRHSLVEVMKSKRQAA